MLLNRELSCRDVGGGIGEVWVGVNIAVDGVVV